MIKRICEEKLNSLTQTFPVVLVVGPRQCGKTTLVRQSFKDWRYLDLERPRDASVLSSDPEGFFEENPRRVIVDEVQRQPGLFPLLRHVVDQQRRPGRFVLTGSAHPNLLRQAGETLAGRAAVLELTPFGHCELAHKPRWLSQRWFWGGYPPLYHLKSYAQKLEWIENYIALFLERDLPNLGVTIAPAKLRRLWTMLAHLHGQILNLSDLARSMDLSHHTISHYLDLLEGAFMIRRLAPYSANIGKRLVKSPKIYIRDSGLLHYFLGFHQPQSLYGWPKIGASFEGTVVEELAQRLKLKSTGIGIYFWRTQAGGEVDLIVESGRRRTALEIKYGRTLDRRAHAGLRNCMKDLDIRRGILLYGGTEHLKLGHATEALPWDLLRRAKTLEGWIV